MARGMALVMCGSTMMLLDSLFASLLASQQAWPLAVLYVVLAAGAAVKSNHLKLAA